MIAFLSMGGRQNLAVCAGALAIAATGLHPPWVQVRDDAGPFRSPLGHEWLFLPPEGRSVEVDLSRLLIEWAIVAALAAAFYWASPSLSLLKRRVIQASALVIGGIMLLAFGGFWLHRGLTDTIVFRTAGYHLWGSGAATFWGSSLEAQIGTLGRFDKRLYEMDPVLQSKLLAQLRRVAVFLEVIQDANYHLIGRGAKAFWAKTPKEQIQILSAYEPESATESDEEYRACLQALRRAAEAKGVIPPAAGAERGGVTAPAAPTTSIPYEVVTIGFHLLDWEERRQRWASADPEFRAFPKDRQDRNIAFYQSVSLSISGLPSISGLWVWTALAPPAAVPKVTFIRGLFCLWDSQQFRPFVRDDIAYYLIGGLSIGGQKDNLLARVISTPVGELLGRPDLTLAHVAGYKDPQFAEELKEVERVAGNPNRNLSERIVLWTSAFMRKAGKIGAESIDSPGSALLLGTAMMLSGMLMLRGSRQRRKQPAPGADSTPE